MNLVGKGVARLGRLDQKYGVSRKFGAAIVSAASRAKEFNEKHDVVGKTAAATRRVAKEAADVDRKYQVRGVPPVPPALQADPPSPRSTSAPWGPCARAGARPAR